MSGILLIAGIVFNLFVLWLFCKALHWVFVNITIPILGILIRIGVVLLILWLIITMIGGILSFFVGLFF